MASGENYGDDGVFREDASAADDQMSADQPPSM